PLDTVKLRYELIKTIDDYNLRSGSGENIPDKFTVSVNPKVYREKEKELDNLVVLMRKEVTKYYIDNELKPKSARIEIEIKEDFTLSQNKVMVIPSVTDENFIQTVLKENNCVFEATYGLEGTGEWYLEAGKTYVFGRDENCDCVVRKKNISRRHFRAIIDENGSVSVEDLGSSNGTFINENPRNISGKVLLKDGDIVQLGKNDPVLIKIRKE
ncbi:FHA domain-containing protein, partial [candidate division KSB1 bacterium]